MPYAQGMDELFLFTLGNNWELNGTYANALVADLKQEQMLLQPTGEINHPAWLLSHLNTYHPVIEALLLGNVPDDPLDAPFGQKSTPTQDANVYPDRDTLVSQFNDGHARVSAALENVDASVLTRPMPIERWKPRGYSQAGSILGYLMVRHESLHLGQLSSWRRTLDLPRV